MRGKDIRGHVRKAVKHRERFTSMSEAKILVCGKVRGLNEGEVTMHGCWNRRVKRRILIFANLDVEEHGMRVERERESCVSFFFSFSLSLTHCLSLPLFLSLCSGADISDVKRSR